MANSEKIFVILIGLLIIGYGVDVIKTGRTKLFMRGLGSIGEIPIEGGCAKVIGVFFIILGIFFVVFLLGQMGW